MAEINNLLYELQVAIGCVYLSDLHLTCKPLSTQAKAIIMAIPPERYSLDNWNAAVTYIIGEQCCYQTPEEAKARIAADK